MLMGNFQLIFLDILRIFWKCIGVVSKRENLEFSDHSWNVTKMLLLQGTLSRNPQVNFPENSLQSSTSIPKMFQKHISDFKQEKVDILIRNVKWNIQQTSPEHSQNVTTMLLLCLFFHLPFNIQGMLRGECSSINLPGTFNQH